MASLIWRDRGLDFAFDIRKAGLCAVGALTSELVNEDAFERALGAVSDYRREKALAYRFAQDKRLSLLAGLLLDVLLQERGLRERDMSYVLEENGRPLFSEHEDLHFSLAHSGEMAVAALSDAPVGIDVECLSGFPHDLAEPREWTKMESVGKLLGCGVGTYVDAGVFRMPSHVSIEYMEYGDYLVCIALQYAHENARTEMNNEYRRDN